MSAAGDPTAPHQDPTSWGRLIDSIDAANVFVLVGSWLGPKARLEVSVEDIWQETLWMAWRDRHQHAWQNLSRYRAWLLGIARNRVQDIVRNLGRQKRGGGVLTSSFSTFGGIDTVGGYLPPQSTTPSRTASHLERARILERALLTLEEPLRDLVRLRLFEELSTQEAAERLGVPLSTAKERFVRGTQQYRAELQRLLGGDEDSTAEAP
ncbi:MAG: sigma-70 family RNA polymerase sigma factor [Planctomycetes bacterium]|jgi:RNA polymerase sigma-70 factor (ECF subfamily)|nr:sigma-70 family RNA polymerase sigma factor [Planctomycetota bacterium]